MSVHVAAHKRLMMALACLLAAICATPVWAAHGYAEYGDLKYPAGFSNFAYLNPKAPIGGVLLLGNPDRRTSFDKFNPFTIKGTSAPGLNQLVFESLLITSWDETASGYGLLADDVTVAPDGFLSRSTSTRVHDSPMETGCARRTSNTPTTC